jgi:glycosyltransferase involved in cell wall biosynthesis
LNLLFLGNVIPRKGLQRMLEALSAVDPRIWRLAVVGSLEMDRGYVHGIRGLIKRKNLGSRVKLRGILEGKRLSEAIRSSHLLFMPFAYEGFGIAYLEGMAFGLPAVGSKFGGAGETIRHGITGFLVDPNGAGGLREIVETLHRDRDMLFKMSETALKWFECQPKWDDSMKKIEGFLKSFTGIQASAHVES